MDLAISKDHSANISILKNNGNGNFTETSTISVGNNPISLSKGDIEGDGDIDLFVANFNSNTISILKNNGNGVYETSATKSVGDRPIFIVTGDIDNDGDVDFIEANELSNNVFVYKNNGNGDFSRSGIITFPSNLFSVALSDFDGDGDLDLAVPLYYENKVNFFKNNGNGEFTLVSSISAQGGPMSVQSADFDNNGTLDISILQQDSQKVTIAKNDGSFNFTRLSSNHIGVVANRQATGDIDNDGDIDLLVANFYSNYVSVLKNTSPRPSMSFFPEHIDYKNVFVGRTRTLPMTIFNSGARNLEIGNIVSSNSTFTPSLSSASISPGDSIHIIISFAPVAVKEYVDSLTIYSNAVGAETTKVLLKGNGVENPNPLSPYIYSVLDVPFDQGGKVGVRWQSSSLDTNVNMLTSYTIWRAIPDGGKSNFNSLPLRITIIDGVQFAWEMIGTLPAHRFDEYSFTAPTLYDAMPGNDGKHYFLVSAQSNDPNVFYDSNVDSGFSVDNIAPIAPKNVNGVFYPSVISLRWNANKENDFSRYWIYRSTLPNADPTQLIPLAAITETTFVDENPLPVQRLYYFIVAEDIHENRSLKSNEVAISLLDVGNNGELPKEFSLGQNYPNPFNPLTIFNFQLPISSDVTLKVFDILGREVATLLNNEELQAGKHEIQFDASKLSSGMYFYRIDVARNGISRYTETKKLLLMK